MPPSVLVLGAGFGGLELATMLSQELGEASVDVTVIDRGEHFVFGYSKLDVLFGRASLDAVQLPYSAFAKPGVRLLRETVLEIDPAERRVRTDAGEHVADFLVVALGADYDMDATPGLAGGANEFYSVAGAARMAQALPRFTGGRAVVGVCGAPFKCPPAPSECALLLHDHLVARGLRDDCSITFVIPFATPVPPSPATSQALLEAFAERDIEFVPERRVTALRSGVPDLEDAPTSGAAVLDDGSELPYDIFFGVPRHRAPDVVRASGMAAEDGYIPVDSATLRTRFERVYAVGDVATVGVPKAGVFAEGAARTAASALIAEIRGEAPPAPYDGLGSCYIEFGSGRVGRVDVDFLSGPKPTGAYQKPSAALVAEKREFGSSRRARWFGLA